YPDSTRPITFSLTSRYWVELAELDTTQQQRHPEQLTKPIRCWTTHPLAGLIPQQTPDEPTQTETDSIPDNNRTAVTQTFNIQSLPHTTQPLNQSARATKASTTSAADKANTSSATTSDPAAPLDWYFIDSLNEQGQPISGWL